MKPTLRNGLPRASVVVLTCGMADTTIACLESVVAGRYRNLQIVVVCNGVDASVASEVSAFAERAVERRIDVRVLFNEKNCGACTGRNQALAEVEGRYVAFLDNDILCHDSYWLNRAVELLLSDESIGIVGPRLVRVTRPLRLECAGYAIDPRGGITPLGMDQAADEPSFKCARVVQAVGNFVAPTDAIRCVGGFDTAFDPFGFENIDCCYRVKAAGLKVMCDGQSDLYHVGHVTTGEFDNGGQSIMFSKSLLLRKRWRSAFEREQSLYEALIDCETPSGRGATLA